MTVSSTARRFARTAIQAFRSCSADHVCERDLLGRPREPVTALGSALAEDETGVLEVEENVLEEFERNLLSLGDPVALDGPLAGGGREFCTRPHGVIDLCRNTHAGEI